MTRLGDGVSREGECMVTLRTHSLDRPPLASVVGDPGGKESRSNGHRRRTKGVEVTIWTGEACPVRCQPELNDAVGADGLEHGADGKQSAKGVPVPSQQHPLEQVHAQRGVWLGREAVQGELALFFGQEPNLAVPSTTHRRCAGKAEEAVEGDGDGNDPVEEKEPLPGSEAPIALQRVDDGPL